MSEETATPSTYPSDARFTVYPFDQRADGDGDVIIGSHGGSSFLCVPAEAIEILEQLTDGWSLGEVQSAYERKNGARPDLDEFLDLLAAEGFLKLKLKLELELEPGVAFSSEHDPGAAAPPRTGETRRYHFANLPVPLARAICSRVTIACCALLITLALAASVLDPSVLPAPTALVFAPSDAGLLVAVLVLSLVGVFVHELAHLVAARAAGAPSRMGFGNRLWYLVAETDMTGIWLASRAERCLAFLAGPLVDLASAAVLVLALSAAHHAWIMPNEAVLAVIRGVLFMYLARLLWQFQFFVPTDLYYVIGAAFRCKNLMSDTQTYLLDLLARLVPPLPRRDLSNVPAIELRVVRWFAVIWVVGRAVAFGTLLWITLPVLAGYATVLARDVVGGDGSESLVQGPLMPVVAIALQAAGLVVWMRRLVAAQRVSS